MFKRILIANRGEIALRLVRAVRDLGAVSVAVYAADDGAAPHVRHADESAPLQGSGPAAYLDIARLLAIAREHGCDAVHPGYGFLSERADFASACTDAGVAFIGPDAEQLALFGDKVRARALAAANGVPVLPASGGAVTLAEAQAFFGQHAAGGIVIKALGGGGGRGMRIVTDAADLPQAYARCASEAQSFGVAGVYVERLMPRARHVEVQVLGDGESVVSLGERECTLQRRFQKLVEIAPSPGLATALRGQLLQAATAMARAVSYRSLGTFEFLVDETSAELAFVFIEANPRLQVEHTVTEEVTGLDLVQLQIAVAAGARLAELGLDAQHPPAARGFAIQWRINAETLAPDGTARVASGRIEHLELPAGPGIRVDGHAVAGTAPSPHYDPLLAKLIVHSNTPRFADAVRRSRRALAECRIDGLATNLALLQAIAARPEFESQRLDTRFVETQLPQLLQEAGALPNRPHLLPDGTYPPSDEGLVLGPGLTAVRAPMAARLVELDAAEGDWVAAGAPLAVIEAMKMEHVVHAPAAGRVREVRAEPGTFVADGHVLLVLEPEAGAAAAQAHEGGAPDLDAIRPDLQRVIDRHAFLLDEQRPAAVARRHAAGGRMARENLADLCDEGSFIEYGALAIAAQSRRRSLDDLVANTPADGMIAGIGTVNATDFGPERSRCIVLAYDYTVLAGTQGMRNHHKKDRMLALAHQLRLPVVLFAEGGGGRPGDVDMPVVAGLNNHTFSQFAALSGRVPVVGIVHGRCFAGNAALLGCADVIIATQASNIGMGGPAMIEGGGLGAFRPEEIGPSDVQSRNGVIDLLVADEAQAVRETRRYLSYFQGALDRWECADQRLLRHAVPENRLRVYDVHTVLRGLVDTGSLLELRAGFGAGIVTALARIEGRPVGIMANNPRHLGGAIDAEAADKASRFMQLCDAHRLPMVSLTDTPGFMVGPDIEAQAQVRHCCRMFVAGAHLSIPFFAIVLRKGYGLGAQAMTAGGLDAPVFTVAWPTGEFGAMGLEGAVKLGFRKELEAAAAGEEREALYRRLVARQYDNGQAMNMAATLEIDAVIDPAQTRSWLVRGLASVGRMPAGAARYVDPW
jgi:acetyl/propionyl-CoA carboxylase alpha subunit/acetyl-CoA carboxylase carboxyltransferase component